MHTTVQVVSGDQRRAEALPTPGIRREQAFADEGTWVGVARTEPGKVSGWHHHGEFDTFFYCISGRVRVEHGSGGREAVEAGPGDFGRIPREVVHRASNPADQECVAVVFRVGSGDQVVNVEGPDA